MRLHTLFLATALAAASAMAAETQGQPSGAATSGATAPDTKTGKAATACIDTEVNGYRALSYECLNQKMAPDAVPKPPPTLESEAITHRPPNQMGLPTPATIGNRMGNTFGTSAYPQRPSP